MGHKNLKFGGQMLKAPPLISSEYYVDIRINSSDRLIVPFLQQTKAAGEWTGEEYEWVHHSYFGSSSSGTIHKQ